jgi:hypothetical protein
MAPATRTISAASPQASEASSSRGYARPPVWIFCRFCRPPFDYNRLTGADQAITVRKRNGKVLKTDGPFAETKEWIAGFDVIECASLDEAIEVAAKHPMARFGKIEIRPFSLAD